MGWSRFWRRRQRDAEIAEELESYLAHEAGERIAGGDDPDEARHAAMRKLGNATRVREDVYAMNTLAPIDALVKDVRYAARLLRRSPGFALASILSLALGIGANTAVFQLLDALRLRSLPIARPHELVEVIVDGGNRGYGVSDSSNSNLTNPLWEGLRDSQQAFAGLFAWGTAGLPVGRGRDMQFPHSIWVSGDFFPALGLVPFRGRLLGPADDRRGCAPGGVVISHAYWQRAFGGRDDAIGAPLVIGERTFQVAGVTPPEFFGLEVGQRFDLAVPVCAAGLWGNALEQKHSWWLTAMGRLEPGWTLAQAAGHVHALSVELFDRLAPTGYGDNSNWKALRFTAVPAGRGISQWRQQYETSLWLLLGITGLVLLVACANLANLMLARATARQREFSVRLALGASRQRLMAQSLTESLLIALVGAGAGIVLAVSAEPHDRAVPDDQGQRAAPRSRARLARARLHQRARVPDLRHLRSRTGAALGTGPAGRRLEAGRAGSHRRPGAAFVPASAGRRAGRHLARAGGRRAALRPQLPQPDDGRRRVPARMGCTICRATCRVPTCRPSNNSGKRQCCSSAFARCHRSKRRPARRRFLSPARVGPWAFASATRRPMRSSRRRSPG